MSRRPDARRAAPLSPEGAAFLVSEARAAVGTRSQLARIMGCTRRNLLYIETEGRRISYAERYLLESIIRTWGGKR